MDNGTNCNWRFIKKGSGVWRFSNVANTEMAGVIAVENGTLRYDSIADAGRVCSLGYSDQLFEDYTGRVDDSRRVDHAFELGSETEASANPVFEYTGNVKNWCFSRPLAMKGSARLRHSGGGELRLAHLWTMNGDAKTLTLDGDGENAWLYNVYDEHGTLSLVKDGSGVWNIGGTNQISGSVAVKKGTLNLRHHEAPYTWFKWTHKGTVGNWETANKEIGLFAEDGTRLNSGLAYSSEVVTDSLGAMNLNECEVAVGSNGKYRDGDCPIEGIAYLFDNIPSTQWRTAYQPYGEGTWRQAYPNDPTSWYSIVMRLPDNSPCVDSYDILA
jgi:autotransporter-associated beta strand protein